MKQMMWIMTVVLLLSGLAGSQARAATADAVVGTGTPASCDEAAFDAALATVQAGTRGAITFDCGPASHTIEIYSSATITQEVVIDGGGLIRLFAQGSSPMFVRPRFFEVNAGGWLTLHDIVLEGGRGVRHDEARRPGDQDLHAAATLASSRSSSSARWSPMRPNPAPADAYACRPTDSSSR